MRKVTAGLFGSIDGVVEAPNEWQSAFDEEMGAKLSRMLEEQDAMLLGRVTWAIRQLHQQHAKVRRLHHPRLRRPVAEQR